MQTVATWLQLIGTGTVGFGVVFAWLKVSGRLRRAKDAANGLVVQLRSAVSQRRNAKRVDVPLTGNASLTVEVKAQATAQVTGTGTTEERLARIENNYSTLKPQVDSLGAGLRTEWHDDIDNAIASALEEFSEELDAARWWDIVPTVLGVCISISGYACQLCA